MSTTLLFETIKIDEGKIFNLSYHQERMDESRKKLFLTQNTIHLKDHIHPPKKGLYKCRIVYAENIYSIEYIPYKKKQVHSLKIVSSPIKYEHKYVDRKTINNLLSVCNDADDILIEHNGYICDTSIANIAFFDGKRWYTPEKPLLKGTMRAKLIDEGLLKTKKIKSSEIGNYTQVALMNAMIGFNVITDAKVTHNHTLHHLRSHYDY
ncbi:MAG: Aminodeoxychorismate lyase (EC [uncultured Sulfurovum sp.]|uniref:Aminodeoxychorismate lyase (EC) n=1 Tax=uncultured Sulfurovum sp. TaxID=269237 RepID=A0A6S6SP52_9BACT|nr:MAG: Aminodeoxychorismate lyase (EC [uncultured Sulfurovum sp.]